MPGEMTLGAMATSNRTRWLRQERPHPDSALGLSSRMPRSVRGRVLSTHQELRSDVLGAAANWKEKICGLVVGRQSKGQGAQSQATRHSMVPALFPGHLIQNLHPNPGATSSWYLPTHHNLPGEGLCTFPH